MGRGGRISPPDFAVQKAGQPSEQGYARAVSKQVEHIQGALWEKMLAEFLQQDKTDHQQAAKIKRSRAKPRFPEAQRGVAAKRQRPKEKKMAELVAIRYRLDQIKENAVLACVSQPDDPADEGEKSGGCECR